MQIEDINSPKSYLKHVALSLERLVFFVFTFIAFVVPFTSIGMPYISMITMRKYSINCLSVRSMSSHPASPLKHLHPEPPAPL